MVVKRLSQVIHCLLLLIAEESWVDLESRTRVSGSPQ